MHSVTYKIGKEYAGMTVKDFLKKIHGYSTRQIIRIKKDVDSIRLNGRHVYVVVPLNEGDELCINLKDEEKETILFDREVEIVFENEDIIIFNKPPFMPCHQSKLHPADTLANCFASLMKSRGETCTFRCINRLDRDTSGLVAVAKNQLTASLLGGRVKKEYCAIVNGRLETDKGTIDAPIGRENEWEITRKVMNNGQRAVTHYECLCKNDEYSFVKLKLETGRTHQIRVHLSYLGHPLIGDELYGGDHSVMSRQALHCRSLTFSTPSDPTERTVTSEIYADMLNLLEKTGLFRENI